MSAAPSPGCELPVGLSADIVLCSHGHGDHNAASLVSVSGAQTDYTVETMFCWHDDAQGAKRGDNLIRIVSGRRGSAWPTSATSGTCCRTPRSGYFTAWTRL